ncbi:preprotein translocase subunit YajC [Streptomyces sp. WAC 00631]|uniref:preprotein translocase subunit YajC n=1 Tax=unclassified Streptomyces TaxID=2593676 RepID=UPI000F79BB0D|nr:MULTISPECIES: preprotein translocase subunit YajC [unclassified Streptomyces]MCC5034019.1 preprotein translocase subunit YajC [Streptomyces sp. WAC 00631]MCC9742597.1 preprotein translocase subunit YajC [Streptomyces sp. MNU89]
MNIVTLLPFIVLIGAMVLMTRSAKKKQQQAAAMRDQMQPGTGIRTIGGMYATVKEVGDDTVLLEVAPGVHAVYAKNAVAAVLEDAEYNSIVHGADFDGGELKSGTPVVPDDASSLTAADRPAAGDEPVVDLGKDAAADERPAGDAAGDRAEDSEAGKAAEADKKDDGGTGAK